MGKKNETDKYQGVFYAFVDLDESETYHSKVYVVPSSEVAKVLRESHAFWISQPGRNGKERNDTSMRRFEPDYSWVPNLKQKHSDGWLDQYYESWNLEERQD